MIRCTSLRSIYWKASVAYIVKPIPSLVRNAGDGQSTLWLFILIVMTSRSGRRFLRISFIDS